MAEKKEEDSKKDVSDIQNYSESIRKTLQNLVPKIPKIKIPEFNLPDISKIQSSEVIREQNAWERHNELMGVQDAVLKIQDEILREQKSTSKMTCIILILTSIAVLIAIISLLKSFSII